MTQSGALQVSEIHCKIWPFGISNFHECKYIYFLFESHVNCYCLELFSMSSLLNDVKDYYFSLLFWCLERQPLPVSVVDRYPKRTRKACTLQVYSGNAF